MPKGKRVTQTVIFQRKQRLVNIYSNTQSISWIEYFNKIENGSTFSSISATSGIPASTLKSRFYKWKKNLSDGIKDRRFSGLHKKSNQHLEPEEEQILCKRILML